MTVHKLLYRYRTDLSAYSSEQLRTIPQQGVWSLGQMYDHIIVVAHEYLDNVELCLNTDQHQQLEKTEFGKELFERGGFPPVDIRLPDRLNAPPNNTDSKETLKRRLDELIKRVRRAEAKVADMHPDAKVKHGGMGWLNAKEWFELVEMHSRHHLRQKEKLERCHVPEDEYYGFLD